MYVMCNGIKYKVIKKSGNDFLVEQPNSLHGLDRILDGSRCKVVTEKTA